MKFFTSTYFSWESRKKRRVLTGNSNPFLKKILKLKEAIPTWGDQFFETSLEDRDYDWEEVDELFGQLRKYYSWAVPDERCLNILSHFSPLVEIAAGNGYWAALLKNRNVDIIPFDIYVNPKSSWTKIYRGGANDLLDPLLADRNLFLCYPDEQESIAIVCLENFKGEYIIHVGEMVGSGTLGGTPQAPFGRTTSAEFQISLQESFHCLLVAELDVKLPYGKDCISVWKRTKYVLGRYPQNGKSNDTIINSGTGSGNSNISRRGLNTYGVKEQIDDDSSEDDDDDNYSNSNSSNNINNRNSNAKSTNSSDKSVNSKNGGKLTDENMTYMSIADLNNLRNNTNNSNKKDGNNDSKDDSKIKAITTAAANRDKIENKNSNKNSTKNVNKTLDSEQITYMSIVELNQLRANSSSSSSGGEGNRKRQREEEEEEEEDDHDDDNDDDYEYENEEKEEDDEEDMKATIRRIREQDLDRQYEDNEDKEWACIPADERITVDRAAPCFEHLLIRSI